MEVPVVSFIANKLGVLLTEEAKFLYGGSDQMPGSTTGLRKSKNLLMKQKTSSKLLSSKVHPKGTIEVSETTLKDLLTSSTNGNWHDVHRVRCEIGAIKNKITDLTASLHTYGLKSTGEGIRSSIVEKQQELRQSYQHVVEEDFVGFEEDLDKVVKHLVQVDDYTPSRVVSICSMGGLGKTPLAKKVYHHKDVQNHFHCLAWVCISQQYQTRDILQGIFIKLVPKRKEEVVRMRNEELFEQLYEVQQRKKCLVVLDDIWSVEAWKSLRPAFPNGNMGSRILLTTRNKTLPSQIDPYHIFHEPQCLNDEESWDLLQKKSLLQSDGRDSGVPDTNMEALGRKMVKLCAGLPLAIIVLGGLLATKHTLRECEMVYQNVCSHKWSDDPIQHNNGVSKPCFLYFGHFPEDSVIDAKRLYHLWIADGIIVDDDKVGDETIMDVVERYLGALAQRCIVQVQVGMYTQRIRSCFIAKWHSSICKLKYLQTLDLRDSTFLSNEVIVLHGMEQLTHLYISSEFSYTYKFKLDGLSNLETLEGFDTGSCDVNDLCKLINLRQQEDTIFCKRDNQDLAAFINYLNINANHVRQTSLPVEFYKKEEELTLLKQLLGCHHLYKLSIHGFIPELPEYCQGFSPSLIELTLLGCELEEDPMLTLERLPNLQYLYLGGAFMGDKMVCSTNGFPQHKTLYLNCLYHIKVWEVEKGAMPNLSDLHITFCNLLEMVLEGLRFITTLQRLTIAGADDKFNNKLRRVNGEEGEDFYKVRHVSSLDIR
ncbi:hypothetical protein ACSBR1_042427 [Camellia fascicularis]